MITACSRQVDKMIKDFSYAAEELKVISDNSVRLLLSPIKGEKRYILLVIAQNICPRQYAKETWEIICSFLNGLHIPKDNVCIYLDYGLDRKSAHHNINKWSFNINNTNDYNGDTLLKISKNQMSQHLKESLDNYYSHK